MTAPHPLISAYARRHGLPVPARADGRLTVVIDDTYRVHLQAAPDGCPIGGALPTGRMRSKCSAPG